MAFYKSLIIPITTFYCENCWYDTMQEKWKTIKSNQGININIPKKNPFKLQNVRWKRIMTQPYLHKG